MSRRIHYINEIEFLFCAYCNAIMKCQQYISEHEILRIEFLVRTNIN